MGKGRRLKTKRKTEEADRDLFCQIFLGQDNEPLTDELIIKLAKEKRMSIEELRHLQEQGVAYCRPRDSFLFPTEIGSSDD